MFVSAITRLFVPRSIHVIDSDSLNLPSTTTIASSDSQLQRPAMSEIQKVIPGEVVPVKASRTVHVKSISVKVKNGPRNRDVRVLFKLNEEKELPSPWFSRKEEIFWAVDKQFSSPSKVSITIREYHKVHKDKDIAVVSVTADELFMNPVILIDEPDEAKLSVKIECEAAGAFIEIIRLLVEASQEAMLNMKTFLEQLGRACGALNVIVSIADPVSDVHPAAGVAVAAVTSLYEACKERKECYEAASDLMADIASFLPFAEVPEGRLKSAVTTQTAREMLILFEEVARWLIECSSSSSLGGFLSSRIGEVTAYKDKFRKSKESLDWCIKAEIWKTVLSIEERAEDILLARLEPVMDAFYTEKYCFPGSRQDTLRAIADWSASESTPKLFWLHGFAGSGKTTIANTVAKLFHSENRLAGYFFCDSEHQDPQKIMPTIAYQLSKWHAAYRKLLIDVLHGPEELELRTGLEHQLELLVKQPLAGLSIHLPPAHKPLIMVLDALDECSEAKNSRRSFTSCVIDIATVVPWLKVFVTSRKSSKLDELFRRDDVQQLDISNPLLDLPHDISAYAKLHAEDQASPANGCEEFTRDAQGLLQRILTSLETLHLIEDTQTFGSKCGIPEKSILDKLFFTAIRTVTESEGYNANSVAICRNALAVMSCMTILRPPSEGEFLYFLHAFEPNVSADELRIAVSYLQPIIFRNDHGVMHIIFPPPLLLNFISDRHQSGQFFVDLDCIKHGLARRSLETMQSQLKFDPCRLQSSCIKNEEVPNLKSRVRKHIADVLLCSCLYWMDYITQAGGIQSLRDTLLDILCSAKGIFWIEALTLIGALETGKNILLRCIEHFKDDEEITCAARELYVFISNFSSAMEISTPHVYVSALSWMPAESSIARNLRGTLGSRSLLVLEEPRVLELHTSRDDVQRYSSLAEGLREAWCIAFSPEGSRIVAGYIDGTLQIWDCQTGKSIVGRFKGHEYRIDAVAFSPDGSRIVSGDTTLRIWDANTGALVAGPIRGHTYSVRTVAYSPDGTKIVSGSGDKTIRIWDAQTGDPVGGPLEDHSYVYAVVFSPDGSRIISASNDETVRIWDARSGSTIGEPLRGHKDYVLCLAYSPDGNSIVTGSLDNTLRIWDAHSSSPVGRPMEGHEGRVWNVAYSPDGRGIISESDDMTLRIWDARGGAPIGVLRRGESRWDSDEGCFVSIPSWWPEENHPMMLSLIRSDAPLHVSDDGWIRTLDGGLFLWVPPKYRNAICQAMPGGTDNEVGPPMKIDWKGIRHGRDWVEIMDVDEDSGNDK